MRNQNFFGQDFVELRQRAHREAGTVHKSLRLQQAQTQAAKADMRDIAVKRASGRNIAPALRAIAWMTQKPALWRVAAYSPPGLPRPAISLITSLLSSLFQRLALYRQATLVRYGVIAAHRITHTVFAAASLSQTKVAWLYRFAPAVLLIQKGSRQSSLCSGRRVISFAGCALRASLFCCRGHGGGQDHRIFLRQIEREFNMRRQRYVLDMQRLTWAQFRQIHFNKFRQMRGQTDDFNFSHHMGNDGSAQLNRFCDFLIQIVKRHFFVNFLLRLNALKIDMEHRRFERMALNISQEYRLRCAVQFKVENRSMERLFLKRMKKRVLVQCDQLLRAARAINNARRFSAATQTAARARTLLAARLRDHFHHTLPLKIDPLATICGQALAVRKQRHQRPAIANPRKCFSE